jgi:hypothetical protein
VTFSGAEPSHPTTISTRGLYCIGDSKDALAY